MLTVKASEIVAKQSTNRHAAAFRGHWSAHVGKRKADNTESELVDRLRQRVVYEYRVIETYAWCNRLAAEIAGVVHAYRRVVAVLEVSDGSSQIGCGATVQLEEVVRQCAGRQSRHR